MGYVNNDRYYINLLDGAVIIVERGQKVWNSEDGWRYGEPGDLIFSDQAFSIARIIENYSSKERIKLKVLTGNLELLKKEDLKFLIQMQKSSKFIMEHTKAKVPADWFLKREDAKKKYEVFESTLKL